MPYWRYCRYVDTATMSGPEFRVSCEWLGLNMEAAADRLEVAHRTVMRWGHGHRELPEGVSAEVRAWLREAQEVVDLYVDCMRLKVEPVMTTFRTDAEAHAIGFTWPASWHRAITARVLLQVPDMAIVYPATAAAATA